MASDVAEQFRGLPMDELIGGPLNAACIAQYKLATVMVAFIEQIGFISNSGDNTKLITKTLDFDLERPVDNGTGSITSQIVSIKAPVLGLVPIPALLIESVTINFTMEVKTATLSKDKTDASLKTEAGGGIGIWKASVTGSVATTRENTRSTDNSAKYDVSVIARQQQPQEGMNKLMDLLASAVEPIKISSGSSK